MPWYDGPPLLYLLETVHVAGDRNLVDVRFPVQWVVRDGRTDYRGYAGEVAGGVLRVDDEVLVCPLAAVRPSPRSTRSRARSPRLTRPCR